MRRRASILILFALLCIHGAASAEWDTLTAPTATPERHWWEDLPWKQGVLLDGRSIEIAHAGAAVYIDYVRFVDVETGRETLWTSFDALQPSDAVTRIPSLQAYDPSLNRWAVRTDEIGHIGGGTLYASAGSSPPNLTLHPGLSGRFDVYLGVRATHFPVQVGLRFADGTTVSEQIRTVGDHETSTQGDAPVHFTIAEEDGVYFAWPSIARRANGELLAVTYAGGAHTDSHGRVVLYRSHDDGLTWDDGTVVANTILDDRDPGILVTHDDTIIITSRVAWWRSGADSQDIDPVQAQALLSRFQRGYLIRSTDGGETWSEMFSYPFQPKGPIQLADGTLFAVAKESATGFRAYTSTDLGLTWRVSGLADGLPPTFPVDGREVVFDYSEPHFVETAPGHIILYIRAHAAEPRDRSRETSSHWLTTSVDGGRTWSKPVQTPVEGYPPHALLLRDGRILLSYGYRWHPYGQRAWLSDDGIRFGKYQESIIRDDAINADLGYPSSIELDDGRILTVYYQKPSLQGKTAFMGTIWSIDERLSDLWIGSPEQGAVLSGPTPVHIVSGRPALNSVVVNVDDRILYEGPSIPTDLHLDPAELGNGNRRLDVVAVDRGGTTYRQSVDFVVEHVRVRPAQQADHRTDGLSGFVTLEVESLIRPEHVMRSAVTLSPVDREGAVHEIYSGSALPEKLTLDTTAHPDGAYNVTIRIAMRSGVESETHFRIVVQNRETLEDEFLPPSQFGWFGVIDRLKTTRRSDGWEFVGEGSAPLFGDVNRIRARDAGDAHDQYLIWELPRLRSFSLVLYTQALDSAGAVDAIDAAVALASQAIRVDVSSDDQLWVPVPFSIEVIDTAESETGASLLKLEVEGQVLSSLEADFIRVTLSPEAGATAAALQLGRATFEGLR